jgi:hypothetical protein
MASSRYRYSPQQNFINLSEANESHEDHMQAIRDHLRSAQERFNAADQVYHDYKSLHLAQYHNPKHVREVLSCGMLGRRKT